MSVRRCQEEVDSREYAEWMGFYEIRPFGEEANDFRGAVAPWVNANIHRGKGSSGPRIEQFYPRFSSSTSIDRSEENIKNMRMQFECFVASHNNKVKKRKR